MKKEKKLEKNGKIIREVISTNDAPKAIGPYSQGIALKKTIFFSGQIPVSPETGELVEGGIEEQTKQVLANIDALLKAANLTVENVVKTTIFLTDMDHFATVNTIYANYFSFEPPARSCVAVSALPLNSLVEIEVIAAH